MPNPTFREGVPQEGTRGLQRPSSKVSRDVQSTIQAVSHAHASSLQVFQRFFDLLGLGSFAGGLQLLQ